MDKANYYKTQPLCCNPLELEGHKAVKKNLRQVSQKNLSYLHSIGITWVTNEMKLCVKCCFSLITCTKNMTPVTSFETFEDLSSPPPPSVSSIQTPSSTESNGFLPNFEKIKALLAFLEIPIDEKVSRFDASSSNYRVSTLSEMFSKILNKITPWFPSEISDTSEDFNALLLNLKSALSKTDAVVDKIEILKLLPRRWTYVKIKSHFEDATQHMITKSKKYDLGIQPLSKAGRPSHDSDIQNNIVNFYLRDDISRPFPGLKDTISIKPPNGVRQNYQKRLLLAPLDMYIA